MTADTASIDEASVPELLIETFSRIVRSAGATLPVIEEWVPPAFAWVVEILRQHFLDVPVAHIIIEGVLTVWLVYIIFFNKPNRVSKAERLTAKEEQDLIDTWTPEPLVPQRTGPPKKRRVVNQTLRHGASIVVDGKELLNFTTFNFLGVSHRCPEVVAAATKTIKEFGVGACGPPGFYGTINPHMNFEKVFRTFLGCEEVILYSYAFSTVASAIPAYSKRGDIIFCDEGVGMPVRMGVVASRSEVRNFKHNDMDDLERLLEEQEKRDKADGYKKKKKQRRFAVVEGLYANYGDIVDLHRLCQLRMKYNVRIFLDESYSFGVIGNTGRGVLEYYGLGISDIDMMTGSLENSMGSIGGFAAGTKYLVDHQRLAGLGYCFSASLPPLLADSAVASLNVMQSQPERFITLQNHTKSLRTKLGSLQGLRVEGHMHSPLVHIRLTKPRETVEEEEAVLQSIVDKTEASGVAFSVAQYARDMDKGCPRPSIRVCVSAVHTEKDVNTAAAVLITATRAILE